MTVVIDELVFKGEIVNRSDGVEVGTSLPASSPADLERIVELCVAEVMRTLERREER